MNDEALQGFASTGKIRSTEVDSMSIVAETRAPFRVEDLSNPGMPEKFVEVIEGELVVMPPAFWEHNDVAAHILGLFMQYCESHPHVQFASDNNGFLLERDPDVLLCPDVSLFRMRPRAKGRWMKFSPELAVEVLSSSNNASEMAYKRRKYFEHGSEQVWIADPEDKSIEFYFRDGRCLIVQGDEIVKGEGIAEGMEINLQKIFKVRES